MSQRHSLGGAMRRSSAAIDVDPLGARAALDVAAPVVLAVAPMPHLDCLHRVAATATHRPAASGPGMILLTLAATNIAHCTLLRCKILHAMCACLQKICTVVKPVLEEFKQTTRIWHVPAKHANRMDARAHSSSLITLLT